MIKWLHLTLVVLAAAILVIILLLILKRCFRSRTPQNFDVSDVERSQSLQSGIARLHQVSPHNHQFDRNTSNKTNYYLFKRGTSTKPVFSWADHPSLVTDAVENGWSRFAFTNFVSSPSVKSASFLLGACGPGDQNEPNVEIGWEVSEGSADFMQKIRLNPNMKNIIKNPSSSIGVFSVIRTALPLPGPNLGNSSFPQEAYFEITILGSNENGFDRLEKRAKSEGDKIKLIGEDFNAKNSPDSLGHVKSSHSQRRTKLEEVKIGGKNEIISFSVGLTGGGPLPLKIPGSYQGSIGFNSTGSVYLDGTKLIFESEKDEWGISDKVIGCGYNPSQKRVFFTVDSQLAHEIHCHTEEFGSPLYPILAANRDLTVLVNLGQSPFKYPPANLSRTPNPCFIGPMATSPVLGYEDSKELFSMGRIDAQWLQRSATRSNNNTVNSIKAMEEYDQESEGDLFEIVLDSTGRSPYTPTYQ